MDTARIQKRLKVARGEADAEVVISGGWLANVFTGEWLCQDIALYDGVIVGLGKYSGPRVDVSGKYVLPGLIDGHMHLESSMLTPTELSRALLPLGTTTIVSDPHEIANVWGAKGLDYLLAASEGLPLDIFFMLPSCVPASPLGTSGAVLTTADLKPYRDHPRVLGLAEVMNYPGLIAGGKDLLEKIVMFPNRPCDGHAPLLSGQKLNAYRLPGIGSEHECSRSEEAWEKLRLGFYVMLREGSLAKNLADLLAVVTSATLRRTLLVTDDCHPGYLLTTGHLTHLLGKAVSLGLSPIQAVTMVTLNPAEYFGLRDRGAIAPGLAADLVVVDDLTTFRVDRVWKDGNLVVEDGRLSPDLKFLTPPPPFLPLKVKPLLREALFPPATAARVKVIGLIPGQLLTDKRILPTPVKGGRLATDPARDLLKMAVVERHQGSGRVGLGLIQGFGLQKGALASSVAHDCHNLVAVGASEDDMLAALHHLIKLQGGLAVAAEGKILAELPLPIAGLLSPLSLAEVAAAYDTLTRAYLSLGGVLSDPFMALSFMALEVIPALKLTDQGLVDVDRFQVVPLFDLD